MPPHLLIGMVHHQTKIFSLLGRGERVLRDLQYRADITPSEIITQLFEHLECLTHLDVHLETVLQNLALYGM